MATILVIDDEPGIRDLLDTLLSRKGYDVVLADSGQKGLEVFRRARPDVIVLDLKMPGMNGVTVLQQIRSLNPTQPVIVLTGAATPESEQQVRALGVTEYVEKEFSLHLLGDALKRELFQNLSKSLVARVPVSVTGRGSGNDGEDRMTHAQATCLRLKWGEQPNPPICSHPTLVLESNNAGYFLTGNLLCTTCGEVVPKSSSEHLRKVG